MARANKRWYTVWSAARLSRLSFPINTENKTVRYAQADIARCCITQRQPARQNISKIKGVALGWWGTTVTRILLKQKNLRISRATLWCCTQMGITGSEECKRRGVRLRPACTVFTMDVKGSHPGIFRSTWSKKLYEFSGTDNIMTITQPWSPSLITEHKPI